MTHKEDFSELFLCYVIFDLLLILCHITNANPTGTTYNHGFKSSIQNLTEAVLEYNDPGVRPICPGQETVNVTVDMGIRQLINLDEPSQTVEFNIWMRLRWRDCQLTWNPSHFNGTTSIVLPINRIWKPDITLYNSISVEFYGIDDYQARIYYDGTVAYNFPTKLEILCPLSVTNFPFDSQICILIFGSWSYNGFQVDIASNKSDADLTSMEENVEWVIEKVPGERHVLYYGCCVEPFPDMTYYIYLKRKPDYYIVNIIVPSMLVTLVACLGFFLPADSGEKIGLELTVMLAMSVFQLLIADHLPPSADDTPWISKFFTFTLILSGGASFWQVIVLNMHHRGERPMPKLMKSCFLKPISVVTCVPIAKDKKFAMNDQSKISDLNQNGTYPEENTKNLSDIATNDSELWIQFALMLDRIGFVVFALSLTIGCIYIFVGIRRT